MHRDAWSEPSTHMSPPFSCLALELRMSLILPGSWKVIPWSWRAGKLLQRGCMASHLSQVMVGEACSSAVPLLYSSSWYCQNFQQWNRGFLGVQGIFLCLPVSVTEGRGGKALSTKLPSKAELDIKAEWREVFTGLCIQVTVATGLEEFKASSCRFFFSCRNKFPVFSLTLR